MSKKSIVFLTFLTILSCKANQSINIPSNTTSTSPTTSSSEGLNLSSSPKPSSDIIEETPNELPPLQEKKPFIIGKPAKSFNSSLLNNEDSINTPIIPSRISGYVKGYDVSTRNYINIPNATVVVGNKKIIANEVGFYSTENEISELTDISAQANGYISSTITKVRPGINRNLYLQSIINKQNFNPNTIVIEFKTLAGAEPTKAQKSGENNDNNTDTASDGEDTTVKEKQYPSILSFGDLDNSRFIPTLINKDTGRYRLEINPVGNNTIVKGQLLIYDLDRDSFGNPTNPTQIKKFIYKPDITFRVGDKEFPGLEGSKQESTTTSTTQNQDVTQEELLKNFVNISARFYDENGFNTFVCNAYIVFPNGEKVLASTYKGIPTTISFRLPKINNVSYRLEAHAGNATKGSDILINDLKGGDYVEAYLLAPPSDLKPSYYNLNESTRPTFSWSKLSEAKSYKLEVSSTDNSKPFKWEAYTNDTIINFPSELDPLYSNTQFRFHLQATDYNFNNISLIREKNISLPKGYRVSYNTVLFRTAP